MYVCISLLAMYTSVGIDPISHHYILFMPLFTKVATLSYNLGIILWYPFGRLTLIFVYVLAAQTPAGQAGPKFKTVCQRV